MARDRPDASCLATPSSASRVCSSGDSRTAAARDYGRRLDTIIDIAELDPGRTVAWTLVHLVDYWLWALGVGLTEDPKLCHTITAWLLVESPA